MYKHASGKRSVAENHGGNDKQHTQRENESPQLGLLSTLRRYIFIPPVLRRMWLSASHQLHSDLNKCRGAAARRR